MASSPLTHALPGGIDRLAGHPGTTGEATGALDNAIIVLAEGHWGLTLGTVAYAVIIAACVLGSGIVVLRHGIFLVGI